MAKSRQTHRKANTTTLLMMGEGECDEAFLAHMKSIYHQRQSGRRVQIAFSGGGSPHNIIKDTIKKTSHIAYDSVYILMDADVPIKPQDKKKASEHHITILLSTPICLEGMLLSVLGCYHQGLSTALQCKQVLHPKLGGKPVFKESYARLFTKAVLDSSTHKTIMRLRGLM